MNLECKKENSYMLIEMLTYKIKKKGVRYKVHVRVAGVRVAVTAST